MLTAALKIRITLKYSFMTFVGTCEFMQARNRFGRPLLHKLVTKIQSCSCKSLIKFAVSTAIKGKRKGCFGVLATRAALMAAGLLKDSAKDVSKSRLVRQYKFRFVTKRGTQKRGVVNHIMFRCVHCQLQTNEAHVNRDAAGTKCDVRTVR